MGKKCKQSGVIMSDFGFFHPLRNIIFTRLWIGQSLSRLGDSVMSVMLPLVVYYITGSTLNMGLIMTLMVIPQVVLLPFAGLLVDYTPRIRIMVISDLVRFCLVSVLAILSFLNQLSIPALYVYAIVAGTMSALFQPAYSAVRAQVFNAEIRNAANSLTQMSEQTARLVGPALGGLILSFSSITIGFTINAISFLLSIFSLLFIRLEPTVRSAKKGNGLRSYLHELLGGYHELRKHPWLWINILFFTFSNIAFVGFMPILVPWLVKEHLHMPAFAYGFLMSANGMGALCMALVYGQRATWPKRGVMAYCGVGISSITLAWMPFVSWLPALMLLMALEGMGTMLFILIWEGSLQELVPGEAYGRVASLDMFGSWALLPLGYLMTGFLTEQIGGIWTMVIQASVILVMTISVLTIRDIRSFK